jgi:enoyl-CoA hydratase/carnithine racemase
MKNIANGASGGRADMTDKILFEQRGHVAYVTLNNPAKHNAISLSMFDRIQELMRTLADDSSVRIVVLRGAGDKAFAAGADISEFATKRSTPEEIESYVSRSEPGYASVYKFPKPTIAMIQGWCVGGGLAMAAACDLRICNDVAKFCNPTAKVAVGWGASGIKRVLDIIGPTYTKEMVFTGQNYTAQQAERMGFVNAIFPAAEFEKAAEAYIEKIASLAPLSVSSVKQIVRELLKDANERDNELCHRLYMQCYTSADYAEGHRAFMEKRKPNYVGR